MFVGNQNYKLNSNFLMINKLNDSKVNQTRKINELMIIQEPIAPSYHIKRMETEIKIKRDRTYGQVTENVQYILRNGLFSSIIRKISLAGSSDSIIAFKVSSK